MQVKTIRDGLIFDLPPRTLHKKTATAFVQKRAREDLSPEDQARFAEVVETEVMNLHEGNIAPYRIQPLQYKTWKAMRR